MTSVLSYLGLGTGKGEKQEEKARKNDCKIKFKIMGKENGVNIYQTKEANPIKWEDHKEQQKKIIKEDVHGVKGAFTLKNVFTKEECKQFIQLSEKMGFSDALVTTSLGMVKMDIRNNKRVIWQSDRKFIEDTLWERIKDFMPDTVSTHRMKDWKKCGMNERLRFYRYTGGEQFEPHYDGQYFRNSVECSLLTFILYLNKDPELKGGETSFFRKYKPGTSSTSVNGCRMSVQRVTPEPGMALIFYQGNHPYSPLHEGTKVISGVKYAIRSDVMYSSP
ncbi:hypothetical protein AAMO2058_000346400 [Amorphochlora amoebiformis]